MHSVAKSISVIRFGVFEADPHSGELRKNGVKVKIQDLPFRALLFLLSRPNEVLSREQFRQALWPEGVFVDFDHGISSAINRLRDAVGDSADNPIFIETVERRGYRWIAPTHIPASPAVAVGPILVKAEPRSEVKPEPAALIRPLPVLQNSKLLLILPIAALLLVLWSFWPTHRAASAGTKRNTVAPPSNPAPGTSAEQFYLKGRFYWEKRTPEGLNQAVDAFTQSIVRDPNYAPAYVGLADCYNLLREYTLMPASDAYPRALAAAQKAVELDDQSSEAHASLGFALFYGSWDANGAEREFRRALELNPRNSVAHHWYATYLSTIGRHSEAMAEIERAQALDPASKSILADKGDLLTLAGRRNEGIALLKQLEAAEPDFVSVHRYLKTAYLYAGDYPQFLEEWKKEATLMRDSSNLRQVESAQKGFAAGGYKEMLQNIRAQQSRLYLHGEESPYKLAQTDTLLGNKQEALQYLKLAYDHHDEQIVQALNDQSLIALHDDPAFKDVLSRLSFPTH